MSFENLGLAEPLLRAVRDTGYTTATPIQQQAIPLVAAGRDVLGVAQTGTGKTAAFTLPLLQRMWQSAPAAAGAKRPIRALVLTPTRELAAQIGESARTYGKHLPITSTVIFGGVGQYPQEQALRRGVDLLIATPGRLLDLMNQRIVSLAHVEYFVLDEADRMLDMGFIHDIKRVTAVLPKQRQTLFFSATMPREIQALAATLLKDPAKVEVAAVSSAAETVTQSVHFVDKFGKQALLERLLGDPAMTRALVFTRTKHGADRVARKLSQARIAAEAIHGNKSQNARLRALAAFKAGTVRVLVASDLASRGLDIDEISHVINFEIPNEPETYVHRIGRTGRAGASGIAISLCDHEERGYLRDIERLMNKRVPVASGESLPAGPAPRAPANPSRFEAEDPRHGHAPRPQQQHRDHGHRDQRRDQGRPQHGRPQHGRPQGPRFSPTYDRPQPDQRPPQPGSSDHQRQQPEQQRQAAAHAPRPVDRPVFKRRGPPPPTW